MGLSVASVASLYFSPLSVLHAQERENSPLFESAVADKDNLTGARQRCIDQYVSEAVEQLGLTGLMPNVLYDHDHSLILASLERSTAKELGDLTLIEHLRKNFVMDPDMFEDAVRMLHYAGMFKESDWQSKDEKIRQILSTDEGIRKYIGAFRVLNRGQIMNLVGVVISPFSDFARNAVPETFITKHLFEPLELYVGVIYWEGPKYGIKGDTLILPPSEAMARYFVRHEIGHNVDEIEGINLGNNLVIDSKNYRVLNFRLFIKLPDAIQCLRDFELAQKQVDGNEALSDALRHVLLRTAYNVDGAFHEWRIAESKHFTSLSFNVYGHLYSRLNAAAAAAEAIKKEVRGLRIKGND